MLDAFEATVQNKDRAKALRLLRDDTDTLLDLLTEKEAVMVELGPVVELE